MGIDGGMIRAPVSYYMAAQKPSRLTPAHKQLIALLAQIVVADFLREQEEQAAAAMSKKKRRPAKKRRRQT